MVIIHSYVSLPEGIPNEFDGKDHGKDQPLCLFFWFCQQKKNIESQEDDFHHTDVSP